VQEVLGAVGGDPVEDRLAVAQGKAPDRKRGEQQAGGKGVAAGREAGGEEPQAADDYVQGVEPPVDREGSE
jgi:hypothetical protein